LASKDFDHISPNSQNQENLKQLNEAYHLVKVVRYVQYQFRVLEDFRYAFFRNLVMPECDFVEQKHRFTLKKGVREILDTPTNPEESQVKRRNRI